MTEASTELEDAPRPFRVKSCRRLLQICESGLQGMLRAQARPSYCVWLWALIQRLCFQGPSPSRSGKKRYWLWCLWPFLICLMLVEQAYYFQSRVPPTTLQTGAGHKLLWPLSSRWDWIETRTSRLDLMLLCHLPVYQLENQRVLAPQHTSEATAYKQEDQNQETTQFHPADRSAICIDRGPLTLQQHG